MSSAAHFARRMMVEAELLLQTALQIPSAQRQLVEACCRHSSKSHFKSVLDLGCGAGAYAGHFCFDQYLGIDSDPARIAVARRKYSVDAGASFVVADVSMQTPYGSGSFDLVLLIGILHHLDDASAQALLTNVARRLSGDGIVVSLDPYRHDNQTALSRFVQFLDRGSYIRPKEAYLKLLPDSLGAGHLQTSDSALLFPQDLLMMILEHRQ